MKLALGTAQFGLNYGIANRSGQVNQYQGTSIVAFAREHGIDTIDTAIGYGDSEAMLGSIGIEGFHIVTKLPAVPDDVTDVPEWAHLQIEGSLQRLRVESVSAVLLHRPEQLLGTNGKALVMALQDLKSSGRANKIGVSIYGPDQLDMLMDACPIDIIQAPFNLIDRRLQTSGWLQRLSDANVEVHVRSAFLQGLLLMSTETRPARFGRWTNLWQQWDNWLTEHPGLSRFAACIGFVQGFDAIDRLVVGVDGIDQLKEIFEAAQRPTPQLYPDLMCTDEQLINPANWSKS